ncbi:hypothetical protein BS47DRAFT_445764 [Hydnum rufescens UP504]|uniref:JmjC domain-containing protein n=1 Tax=Hydnum rufescens UP504 TaxID=1448309 RepID=A0A9P6B4Z6_9AGAM|nr:hypothetical protein BS47DRAFT_445764 [Hydnum rufescens UP504]
MVIIPRMSCHQVVNHGGISLKVAWSRMPMSSMEAAVLYELPVYHRVGRPEIYRVKHLLHQTIEQLTLKYGDLNRAERNHFRRLVRIMSEIHVEEYHPDYKNFLVETTNDLKFTCDCCSADIFQTYFECKKCTPPNEPDQFYTMCTMCYVEGRSCKCEDMAPRVLRPWPELLRIRNNAASVARLPQWTLDHYNTSPHLAIFKAAVLLRDQRKASPSSRSEVSKLTRRCSPSRNSEVPHIVPIVASVRCPPCHRSTCYQHTLQFSFLHVAEAILIMHEDPSYQLYHSLHIQGRSRWRDAHEPGSETNNDIKIRLTRAALRHSVCRPADAQRTRLGWYDNAIVVADDLRDSSSDSSLTSLSDEPHNPGSLRVTCLLISPRMNLPPLNLSLVSRECDPWTLACRPTAARLPKLVKKFSAKY